MSETGLPVRGITAVSAVSSYYLVNYQPKWLLFSKPSLFGTFAQLWTLQALACLLWVAILWPKFFSPLRKLPAPKGGSWWNGHFAAILKNPTGVPMAQWINTIPNEGLIYYRGLLNAERLFPTSPKALSEVLTTKCYDFIKPDQLQAGLVRVLGYGVLLAEGDEHKVQRKHLMPAFAFRHIKDLYPIFWSKSRESVFKMTDHLNEGGVNRNEITHNKHADSIIDADDETPVLEVGHWSSRATLDIIGLAGMGKDFGAIQDEDAPLSKTYRKIFKPTAGAIIFAILGILLPPWVINLLPFKRNNDINNASTTIRNICKQEIKEKKERLEKKEYNDVDILSIALESGGFSDDNLVDQMMTFLAAGHETTASSMTWAIYMLCLNASMQTRLREEIRANLPSLDSNEHTSSLEIDHMPYLNAVCSEVLRYYPPVPLTTRVAARNTTICGQKIPKGTRIMLIQWAVNRCEELWGPDAATFNPERWMPSEKSLHSANGGAASNYSFLTFLHGPRSCIGSGFARSEFACLLAAWVGRFEFELYDKREMDENNIVIKGGITSKPADGLYVRTKVVPGW